MPLNSKSHINVSVIEKAQLAKIAMNTCGKAEICIRNNTKVVDETQ